MEEQKIQPPDKLKGEWMRGRIPYPKHVWSPAGGWYTQPSNWKKNTAIMMIAALGVAGLAFKASTELERRPRMPEEGRFYPSKFWTRQVREHRAAQAKES